MAEMNEIIQILKQAVDYYSPADWTDERAKVYVRQLASFPAWLIDRAVGKHIQTSPYFPRLSDLTALMQKIEAEENTSPNPIITALQRELSELAGNYDPQAWRALAAKFSEAGLEENAKRCLERAEAYERMKVYA